MSLFHISVRNTFFNGVGFIFPILISLIFTPYIVNKLGPDAYGIMGLTGVLWGYFALLDMGLGSGSIKYVSEYMAKKQYEKVNSVINSLLIFYIYLGLFGFIIIFLLSGFFTKTVFNIPSNYISVGIFAFQLSAFGFFVSIIKSVFDGIPKALSRFDISNKINMVFGTLSTLLVVVVLFFGLGLKEVLIVKLSVNIIILAITIIISKKLLPFYKFQFILDRSIFKMLFNYGVWEIFIKLANLAISTLGSLIISILLGPAALTYYLIPQGLTTKINSFNYKISEIIFPISSELASTNANDRLNVIYLKMSKYTLAFKLSLYVPILFYSYEILYYWLGKEFADKGWLVMVFLGLGFFINSMGHLPGLITYGTAKLKITSYYTLINFVVLITTIYPFIKLFGITGAGLSYFVSTIVYIIYLFHVNQKILKIEYMVYIKTTLVKPLLVALLIAILTLVTKSIITNLVILLSLLFVVFILYNIISYLFNVYEKNDVDRIKNILVTYLKLSKNKKI